MHVLIVSPFGTSVNPYIGLFSQGLRGAGATVTEARVLPPMLLTPEVDARQAQPDIIHVHWVERYDPPAIVQLPTRSPELRALGRVALRPVNVGPLYHLRRWRRLRRLLGQLARFRTMGGRVAYTVHNLDPHESGSPGERWALRRMIDTADVLHVHDISTAEAVTRRYGRRSGIAVIPHGHYVGAYPNTVGRHDARARLQLADEAFVYVCLGLMRPYKGLEELLPAFRQVAGEGLRLVVAGRPPDEDYVARLRSLGAGDPRIRLEPRFIPADEVQFYLNAADVAVLPYRQITTSGAALLAFSFGLPIIAPAIGAFPSLVTEERGILYEPGGLLQALRAAPEQDWRAARDPILQWVTGFDWLRIGQQLLAAYVGRATRDDTP
jgi:glycosyltransferase involved in cell wall biosynthesis